MKYKTTMTSREAAALMVSGGTTTDADVANQIADGTILDPDRLTRAHFRRMMGFDFDITEDDVKHHYLITDNELNISVTSPIAESNVVTSNKLAMACIRLKIKHDKLVRENNAVR